MTRINLIPPYELMDNHLIAEYREHRLLVANLRRIFATANGKNKKNIPKEFTLNKGHINFFKDKGLYIKKRYALLQEEMRKREFEVNYTELDVSVWPEGYFNDWEPNDKDMNIVRERISLRISQKPHLYRYYGKYINENNS